MTETRSSVRATISEKSWPERWTPLLLGVLVSFAVPITTGIISYFERDKAARRADAQISLENRRAAIKMYFDHVVGEPWTTASRDHIYLIAGTMGEDEGLRAIFSRLATQSFDESRQASSFDQTDAGRNPASIAVEDLSASKALPPSVALRGVPDLVSPRETYEPSDFRVYIQTPARRAAAANALSKHLAGLSYSVPAFEVMEAVPIANQIRYYKPEHQAFAVELAAESSRALGGDPFKPVLLSGSAQLPNGVIEIWLGGRPPA